MKFLRIILIFSLLSILVLWSFLAFVVPLWAMSLSSQNVPMPTSLEALFILSNYARTPIGMFLTLNLLGLNSAVLIWACLRKKNSS
jgi:type II secretory pathway component PulF